MKHTQITKDKIRETLKRKGIKPVTLPSKEQCIKNLSRAWEKGAWNKGTKGVVVSWNKGKKYPAVAGKKNGNWKGGTSKPLCACGKIRGRMAKSCWDCFLILEKNKGEKHYNWKGGAKTEIIKIRSSAEYKLWRLSVYERDWFTCQMPMCGYKGRDIECHHIKKVKEYPDLILEKSNGITLCKGCHKKIRNREKQFVGLFEQILAIRLT